MKLKHLTFSLLVFLVINSCSEDKDSQPDPITKANITGSVNLYDEGITQVDNSNMKVKVEGVTPSISAITDVNGKFTLIDVPFGTYTIVYEKLGFGTFKKVNIEHLNSATAILNTPSLGKISTTQITNLEANVSGNNIIISVTTNPAGNNGNRRYIRYFLDMDSNVSNESYTYYSLGLISQINPYQIILSQNDLTKAGFSSGQTVNVKVYGDSFWSNEYYDPNLGRNVFPNLNMASVSSVAFVIP
ncbi:carboxypeptidase regulatory-like domain-containing protein [Polaribacter sp. BAL334]|uniref:carboxypeptidase-like regulatory domain-containing protein n=1 Tax=Polaribacter sp. BAL334 TaxID=1708178 RepID=UPI0018D2604C|nr:carboxypeptidase-like regulatory domain-containing protein [Polaribacter sp. BAL334]MBG7612360.1 carboxypeptidase regulatory-like domain-containing protein [Polaribacter sp. BAL334]